MKATIPLPIRRIRAAMELKAITLTDLSEMTGIPYAECSRALSSSDVRSKRIEAIRKAVKEAPKPITSK